MKTSSRERPISSSSLFSSWPARPTNGSPCWSSCMPGASPTNIRSASALPEPNTTLVRVLKSGQRSQADASRYSSTSSARRSSALRDSMAPSLGPAVDGTLGGYPEIRRPLPTPEWTGRGMHPDHYTLPSPLRVGIVGSGRVGTALAGALREAGVEVEGPLGRGERPAGCDAILLCVPDAEIAAAAEVVTARRSARGPHERRHAAVRAGTRRRRRPSACTRSRRSRTPVCASRAPARRWRAPRRRRSRSPPRSRSGSA